MKKKKEAAKNEKIEYVKCSRCELNYISKKQRYCDVCLAEIKGDMSKLLPDEDEELERLCPVCRVNYMNPDDEMCFLCLKEKGERGEPDADNWETEEASILPVDEVDEIPLSAIADEEEAGEEEFEESFDSEEDDFEYVDPDSEEFDDIEDDDDEE